MALSASEIRSVVEEVKPLILDGWIQKVYQSSHEAFTFSIRCRGVSRFLYISTSQDFSRIHLASQKVKERLHPLVEGIQGNTPLPFYLFLRKHCEGGIVRGIRQVDDDRIVEIEIEKKSDTAISPTEVKDRKMKRITLIAELFGRTSNLICVDEQHTILESLRHISGMGRVIKPRKKYISPTTNSAETRKPYPESSKRASRNRFESAYKSESKINNANQPQINYTNQGRLSFLIEQHYLQAESEAYISRLREGISAFLRRVRKDVTRKIESIEKELQKVSQADESRIKGELLKVNMNRVKPGMKSITVINYFAPDQKDIDIELDVTLSPKDNLERYFKRYKKLSAASGELNKRLDDAHNMLNKIEKFEIQVSELNSSPTASDLQQLEAQHEKYERLYDEIVQALKVKRKTLGRKRGKRTQALGPRRFTSADGTPILVGRNNRQNDELTIRLARGNDIWLHVQQLPGSHVVVRTQRNKSVSLETLLDAANLAVFFSKARDVSKPLVDYAQCKYVRKPKGAKPGVVTFSQNKTLTIKLDRNRLERLFASSEYQEYGEHIQIERK